MIDNKQKLKEVIKLETNKYKHSKYIRYFWRIPGMFFGGEALGLFKLLVTLKKAEYYSNTHSVLRHIYLLRLKQIEN